VWNLCPELWWQELADASPSHTFFFAPGIFYQ
jgi:hypothetical protein